MKKAVKEIRIEPTPSIKRVEIKDHVSTPVGIAAELGVGSKIITPYGPGILIAISLLLGKWPDGQIGLLPPSCRIKLQEPWQGNFIVHLPLNQVELSAGIKFLDCVRKLWPKLVSTAKNPKTLRARQGKSVSDVIKEQTKSNKVEIVDALDIPEDEDTLVNRGSQGPYYEMLNLDPNGPSYWTTMFYRPLFYRNTRFSN